MLRPLNGLASAKRRSVPIPRSLVALELHTRHVVWTRQFTTGDNFTRANPVGPDSDVGATPNPFRVDDRDVVGVGDKAGNYYLMNRKGGELQLFEVKAAGDLCVSTGPLRIKPGAPDDSLLVAKLKTDLPCGARMPAGETLSDTQLDQIKAWMAAGAQREETLLRAAGCSRPTKLCRLGG